MKTSTAIAENMKREGIDVLFGYPRNQLLEAAAIADIRTIIVRQERIGLHMADAMSRLTKGRKMGVFCMQSGPGAENAYGGVAYIGCNTGSQPCALTLVEGFVEALAMSREPRLGDCWVQAIRHYYEKEHLAELKPNADWYPPSIFFQGMKFIVNRSLYEHAFLTRRERTCCDVKSAHDTCHSGNHLGLDFPAVEFIHARGNNFIQFFGRQLIAKHTM